MNFNFSEEKIRLTDGVILRYLRMNHKPKPMTTRELSKKMECAHSLISHWEWGRNPLPEHRINQACDIFNLSREEWDAFKEGEKSIPINYRDELLLLIQKVPEEMLPPIFSMVNMTVRQTLTPK